MVWHTIERFLIHIVSSFFIVTSAYIAIRFMCRKLTWEFIPRNPKVIIVVSALLVFAFMPTREAFDVASGQPAVKALTDIISWFIGSGLGAYGLYRIRFKD